MEIIVWSLIAANVAVFVASRMKEREGRPVILAAKISVILFISCAAMLNIGNPDKIETVFLVCSSVLLVLPMVEGFMEWLIAWDEKRRREMRKTRGAQNHRREGEGQP